VYWELSDISWASRWDAYLRMPGGRVHWFSILNSLMVVVVMSSIVAMIMMRTIRRDLARYEGLLGDAGTPWLPCLPFVDIVSLWTGHCSLLVLLSAGHWARKILGVHAILFHAVRFCWHKPFHYNVLGMLDAGAKEDTEESGWKMVSGDVFRSPKDAMLLCVQLGSGVQIILSSFITLFFAALGASRITLSCFLARPSSMDPMPMPSAHEHP
jgi:hypothetical protein